MTMYEKYAFILHNKIKHCELNTARVNLIGQVVITVSAYIFHQTKINKFLEFSTRPTRGSTRLVDISGSKQTGYATLIYPVRISTRIWR